jgi:predicted small secreted protein
MRIVKSLVLVIMVASLTMGFSGCNTVKGAGRDLKQGGQAIENAADRVAK